MRLDLFSDEWPTDRFFGDLERQNCRRESTQFLHAFGDADGCLDCSAPPEVEPCN